MRVSTILKAEVCKLIKQGNEKKERLLYEKTIIKRFMLRDVWSRQLKFITLTFNSKILGKELKRSCSGHSFGPKLMTIYDAWERCPKRKWCLSTITRCRAQSFVISNFWKVVVEHSCNANNHNPTWFYWNP